MVVQPYLDLLPALQKPENQVLQGSNGERAGEHFRSATVCKPPGKAGSCAPTHNGLRHNTLYSGRHGVDVCCCHLGKQVRTNGLRHAGGVSGA